MICAVPKSATAETWQEVLTANLTDDKYRLAVRAIWVSPAVEELLYKHSIKGSKATLKERLGMEAALREWERTQGGVAARYVFWGVPVLASRVASLEDEEQYYALFC